MPQSLSQIYVHIVFHIKSQSALIRKQEQKQLHAYIGAIIKENGCIPIQINGVTDHIHILCSLSRNITVSKLVQSIKAGSSGWIKKIDPYYHSFFWQGGYAVFSVSSSLRERTINYIINQESHHKKVSSKEEYERLLKAYQIIYDERYLWDE